MNRWLKASVSHTNQNVIFYKQFKLIINPPIIIFWDPRLNTQVRWLGLAVKDT